MKQNNSLLVWIFEVRNAFYLDLLNWEMTYLFFGLHLLLSCLCKDMKEEIFWSVSGSSLQVHSFIGIEPTSLGFLFTMKNSLNPALWILRLLDPLIFCFQLAIVGFAGLEPLSHSNKPIFYVYIQIYSKSSVTREPWLIQAWISLIRIIVPSNVLEEGCLFVPAAQNWNNTHRNYII